MEPNWKDYVVGDIFELVPGFAFKSKDFQDSGVPVIKIKNVKANGIVLNDLSYVDSSFVETRADKIVQQGDILITMSGNRFGSTKETWVGKVAQFSESGTYFLNQRVGILRPKDGRKIDKRYGAYVLGSDLYQNLFISIATSSGGQANLSPNQILGADLSLPPIGEQHAIAHILGTLDDKIELNRRMNETLEAMASAIFKSWFVDFDPVRDKAEGRQPEGMDAETAGLFPNGFEDSELGEIPRGWVVGKIGDVVNVVGGGTPSTKNPEFWEDGTHYWATPKDLSGVDAPILFKTNRQVTDAGLRKVSSGLLKKGTVLLSSRAPVGYLAIAWCPIAINQGFIAMVCDGPLSNYYVLNWCNQYMDEIKQRASGTTFAEISKKNFRPISVIVPDDKLMISFTGKVAPVYERVAVNLMETQALVRLRNTLLPKLLTGEIRVKEAENMVGNVA